MRDARRRGRARVPSPGTGRARGGSPGMHRPPRPGADPPPPTGHLQPREAASQGWGWAVSAGRGRPSHKTRPVRQPHPESGRSSSLSPLVQECPPSSRSRRPRAPFPPRVLVSGMTVGGDPVLAQLPGGHGWPADLGVWGEPITPKPCGRTPRGLPGWGGGVWAQGLQPSCPWILNSVQPNKTKPGHLAARGARDPRASPRRRSESFSEHRPRMCADYPPTGPGRHCGLC